MNCKKKTTILLVYFVCAINTVRIAMTILQYIFSDFHFFLTHPHLIIVPRCRTDPINNKYQKEDL